MRTLSIQCRNGRAHSRARPLLLCKSRAIFLADRRSVLQATLRPQAVQAAGDFERRALPDRAFERFPVIANLLDDPVGPVGGQAERLTMLALGAEQTLDV